MDLSNLTHLVTAALALIILIDVSILWLTNKPVPELLSQLVLAVFASYFVSGLRSRSPRDSAPSAGAGPAPAGTVAPTKEPK